MAMSAVEAEEEPEEPEAEPSGAGKGRRRRGRRRRRSRSRAKSCARDGPADALHKSGQEQEEAVFHPHHATSVPRMSLSPAACDGGPISTVMLRNIPCRYTQGSLLAEIDQLGFAGCYDFFYLPMDMRNKTSVGYSFINFLDPADAMRFFQAMEGYRFRRYPNEKIALASPAHLQGLRRNVEHFASSSVLRAREAKYRPVVLQGGFRRDFGELLTELAAPRLNPLAQEFVPAQFAVPSLVPEAPQEDAAPAAQPEAQPLAAKQAAKLDNAVMGEARRSLEDAVAELLRSLEAPEEKREKSWVEQALSCLAEEVAPTPRSIPQKGIGPGWIAEAFSKLVGGCTPATPRGNQLARVLLRQTAPAESWEHPQKKGSGWVDEAFDALTIGLDNKPSRSLSGVGDALHRLRSLGGWAWVAFS